jgi:hypothetical protein
MIEIDLAHDVPPEILSLLVSEGMVEAILTKVAQSARVKWIQLAQERLTSSTQTYIKGIQAIQEEPGLRIIRLVGWLPNAIEDGLDPFDLRETILNNENAKARRPIWSEAGRSGGRVQIGWYANIPFRHGTPETTGKRVGTPMGLAYGPRGAESGAVGNLISREGAEAFGEAIYKMAKRLKAGQRLKEKNIAKRYKDAGGEGAPLLRTSPWKHKSSIYAGMIRVRKPYINEKTGKETTQSQYFTFRRISTQKKEGWLHPGIHARKLSSEVEQHIIRIAPALINQQLKITGR